VINETYVDLYMVRSGTRYRLPLRTIHRYTYVLVITFNDSYLVDFIKFKWSMDKNIFIVIKHYWDPKMYAAF